MKWIHAIRPLCGVATSLLTMSGFRHGHQKIDWLVVVTVFFLTSMAMLWNDYYDRNVDAHIAKGRTLASTQPKIFLLYTLGFVFLSLSLSIFVWIKNPIFGLLCFGMWVLSITYNYTQRNPFLKNGCVSTSIASTAIFPVLMDSSAIVPIVMIVVIFCIISIREFIKDVEDMECDLGHKRTLALTLLDPDVNKELFTSWKPLLDISIVILMF